MEMRRVTGRLLLAAGLLVSWAGGVAQSTAVVLNREQAAAILPATVFFRGQTATIQGRNSAGLKLADGKLVLMAVVDTSGYSSSLPQSYQAYLLTEVPLTLYGGGGERHLAPGAYGFGFVAGDQMTVMDIGGNSVARAGTVRDTELARPTPLQLLADAGHAARFRLYLGRSYVTFSAASE